MTYSTLSFLEQSSLPVNAVCLYVLFLYGENMFPYILACLSVLYASLVWRNQLLQKQTKESIDCVVTLNKYSVPFMYVTHLH